MFVWLYVTFLYIISWMGIYYKATWELFYIHLSILANKNTTQIKSQNFSHGNNCKVQELLKRKKKYYTQNRK